MKIRDKINNLYINVPGSGVHFANTEITPVLLGETNQDAEISKLIKVEYSNAVDNGWIQSISTTANDAFQRTFTSKAVSILFPEENTKTILFYNELSCNVNQIIATIRKSATSNVHYNIKFSDDINNIGSNVSSIGLFCDGKNVTTTFDNAYFPANNFVWIEINTITGSVQEFHLTVDLKQ